MPWARNLHPRHADMKINPEFHGGLDFRIKNTPNDREKYIRIVYKTGTPWKQKNAKIKKLKKKTKVEEIENRSFGRLLLQYERNERSWRYLRVILGLLFQFRAPSPRYAFFFFFFFKVSRPWKIARYNPKKNGPRRGRWGPNPSGSRRGPFFSGLRAQFSVAVADFFKKKKKAALFSFFSFLTTRP